MLSWRGITGNRYVILAIAACIPLQLAFTYAPQMQEIFGSAGPGPAEWSRVLCAGLLVLVVAELEKTAVRGYRTRGAAAGA